MTDRDALYRTICDNPEDDVARLVFADWLDENGEPERAEFIRLQIRLAGTTAADPEYAEMRQRERELLSHADRWRKELPALETVAWGEEFERGFPAVVRTIVPGPGAALDPGRLAPDLREAVARTPARYLDLRDLPLDGVRTVLRMPELGPFRGLRLGPPIGTSDELAREVVAAPHLRSLRALWLQSHGLDDTGVGVLTDCPHLEGLTDLRLDLMGVTAEELGRLFAAPWFANLRTLAVRLDNQVAPLLASSAPEMPRLHSLTLGGHRLTPPGMQAFMRALKGPGPFPALASFGLQSCLAGPEGVGALASGCPWKLGELTLTATGAGNGGAEALASSEVLRSLRVLRLSRSDIRASGARALAESRGMESLRDLDLSNNPLGTGGLAALAKGRHWTNLLSLDLSAKKYVSTGKVEGVRPFLEKLAIPTLRELALRNQAVGARGAPLLADSPHLSNLRILALVAAGLGDGGARAVIESPHLQGLLELDLRNNRIRSGVERLADPSVMPHLVRCRLNGNGLDKTLARKIQERFPDAP